ELSYLRMIVQDNELVRSNDDPNKPGVKQIGRAIKAVVPFLPDTELATESWQGGRDAVLELKWFVAEKYFSPLAGLEDTNGDRKGARGVGPGGKATAGTQGGSRRRPSRPAQAPSAPPVPVPPRGGPGVGGTG